MFEDGSSNAYDEKQEEDDKKIVNEIWFLEIK